VYAKLESTVVSTTVGERSCSLSVILGGLAVDFEHEIVGIAPECTGYLLPEILLAARPETKLEARRDEDISHLPARDASDLGCPPLVYLPKGIESDRVGEVVGVCIDAFGDSHNRLVRIYRDVR